MMTLNIKNLPVVTDLYYSKEILDKKWLFGAILTYLITPLVICLLIIEYNLIMPVGVESPLLRLFLEVLGWIFIGGIFSSPVKGFISKKMGTIFHLIIIFAIPLLFWKIVIVA